MVKYQSTHFLKLFPFTFSPVVMNKKIQ